MAGFGIISDGMSSYFDDVNETFGGISEAVLWAEWIKQEFPDGATVAAVTFNNDYGRAGPWRSTSSRSSIRG